MKYSFPSTNSNYQVFEPVEKIYEVDLLYHWLQLKLGSILFTTNSKIINIIKHGVSNKHDGPDIKNAILMIDGKILIGYIEFHLKESDWFRHKHDTNSNYDNVILHIVRNSDLPKDRLNIPTVELKGKYCQIQDCTLTKINKNINLLDIISHYSFERWQRKVDHYGGLHESLDLLQKEIIIRTFVIFGAGGNKNQFIALANNIDVNFISIISVNEIEQHLWDISEKLKLRWNRKSIRPSQQPRNRMKLASEMLRYIIDDNFFELNSFTKIKNTFISNCPSVKGVGIQTELFGNMLLPFYASRSLFNNRNDIYTKYFEEWKKLKLPYTYSKFSKRFNKILSNSEVRNFNILQGLIEIDNKWCNIHICNLCPLKENYGNS